MFVLSACVLCSALALNPSPSPSPTPPQIAHVTTSERADSTLANTARTTYVVSRQQIERNGYRTVAQALQHIPALALAPLGPIGSGVDFTLRGSASSQTLVLVDGLPAPGSFSNSVELDNMPTTGVERIEVVEGGGSTLYGTGAIGGIINVITLRAAQAQVTMRAGSFDDREISFALPNVQFDRVTANNGFALPNGATRPDVDYAASAIHGNLDRTVGAFDVALRAGLESDHLGVPGPDAFLTPSARESDENQDVNLTLTHRSAQAVATMQLGATAQDIGYWCSAGDPQCFQPGIALSKDSRLMFGARNVVRAANNQLLYGVDLSRGNVRADDGFGDIVTSPMAQAAVYAEDHVSTSWGNAYVGVRGERDGGLGGEISPSAGLVVGVAPQTTLKLNAATAFRAPNATELYFPDYGNPALHPERANVWDATLVNSSVLGGISLGWFGNRTNNLIVPEPVTSFGASCAIDASSFTYEACNVGHAAIAGFTFTAKTLPSNGMAAWFNLTDLYRAENVDTQARLPNDPVFDASLGLDFTARSTAAFVERFGVSAHSQGARGFVDPAQPLFDQPAAFTAIDAYVTLNAGQHASVSLRGFNLGDERYASYAGFPLPGRTYVLELTVR